MKKNIVLKLCFDGTKYHGWQIQKNAVTVQGILKKTIEELTNSKITLYGCSRTDAGVHAKEYFCNFFIDRSVNTDGLVFALNSMLPKDIAVLARYYADLDFHSQYHAKSKEYIYHIYNSRIRDPFLNNRALFYPKPLDALLMNEAAEHFLGTHDFGGFMSSASRVENTVRTVYKSEVIKEGSSIYFIASADGFLYNMVRIMVGTLIRASEGKIKADELPALIDKRDRKVLGFTAAADGLYLNKVSYDCKFYDDEDSIVYE